MRRREIIVGNWKMNGLVESALDLAREIRQGLKEREDKRLLCEVVICPPATALYAVNQNMGGFSSLKLGAQDMSQHPNGAYTGEVAGLMLRDVGCRYVILGHSERRQLHGETDDRVAAKVSAAFRDGLVPIVCLGETLEERQQGRTFDVVRRQLDVVLEELKEPRNRQQLVVAYEPVWAIGTGLNATPEQAQEVHGFLRTHLNTHLGSDIGQRIRIIYGGSMKPSNAASLLLQEDVDGGLIGGASLRAVDFLGIIDALPN
ncbi:MAG: triose-phosphate isomerase [Magnetococcus sp. DMHC-6]